MLNRKYSIKKKEFAYIYKKGIKIYSDNFIIIFTPNNDLFSKFGIVISTKTEKLAVRRNQMRRQIKNIIEKNLNEITKNKNFIIIIKKSFYQDKNLKYLLDNLVFRLKNIK